jgi:3-oxoacyl-[acyl-carrier protein] reductase
MDLGLKGKKVIMNGGSHGIGLATLKTFAAEGADVAFFSANTERLGAARHAIDAAGSGKVFAEVFDMSADAVGYKAWLQKAVNELGGCDIFVHSASTSGQGATGDWQRSLDMDVMGAVNAVEVLTEPLAASGAFNAMKAALITYGSQLSQALAPMGIKVNCVSPGAVEYPTGNWEMIKGVMKPLYDATLAQIPMGRFGEPQEVANTVVFVASPACPYMTGANIVIDGGFTKRVQF